MDQHKLIERNSNEYDPRDDFPEPGIGYVMRNPRCSQLIPLNAEKFIFLKFYFSFNLKDLNVVTVHFMEILIV